MVERADPSIMESLIAQPEYELAGFALWEFTTQGPVRSLHQALKYGDRPYFGFYAGQLLGRTLDIERPDVRLDCLVPIPLHLRRFRSRGYNQSEWIAKGISDVLHLPVQNILKRQKSTRTQTSLNRVEREQNIHDAFVVKGKTVSTGLSVGLVDDVVTTGATITEAALVLSKQGLHVTCLALGLAT